MAARRTAPIATLAAGGLAAALALATPGAQAVGTTHHGAHPATHHTTTVHLPKAAPVSGRVIVVLKSQHRSFALRGPAAVVKAPATAVRAQQSRVAHSIRASGGRVSTTYHLINALAATLTPKQALKLAKRHDVAEIIPDARIAAPTPLDAQADPDLDSSAGVAPAANTCSTTATPQLEPEALEATHADSDVPGALTARSLGYTGAGVTVAWMAEGIDINNPDFIRGGKSVFTDYQDFSSDGTAAATDGAEAFLDASAIGAQGNQVYDVSHFSKLPLNTACKIRVEGEAPGANMVGLKVFSNGFTTTSAFLDAIQYAVSVDHVDVLNQSFGGSPIPDTTQDVVRAADEAATDAGTTITVSTGDAGITNTIGSPADDPKVISVGATTTYRFDLQTGYAAARFPGITGWLDDNISSLSSAGYTADASTENLVAPGELNFGLCSTDLDTYEGCADYAGDPLGLEASGGTSESAPVVAGVAALVIQAYKSGHSGTAPTPFEVKDILTSTADDIQAPASQMGAGLVDAYKAVQLAASYGPGGTTTGSTIRSSHTQLTSATSPGSSNTFTDVITNEGSTAQRVDLSSRELSFFHQITSTTLSLSDSGPTYTDFQGYADNYATTTFTVPSGSDRLAASIAYPGASSALSARVRMTLVDPAGHLAAYSLPQGVGNYGHVEVASPLAGTWTAYITSRPTASGGSDGLIKFAAGVANYHSFGTVSPSKVTLAAGESAPVTLTVNSPGTPSDVSGSLVMSVSDPADLGPSGIAGAPDALADRTTTTVPVVLRAIIPAGSHHFTQTFTGPNGRDNYPGVKFYYSIAVPAGTPSLNVNLGLADKRNAVQASLISPEGSSTAFASNTSIANDPDGTMEAGLQLHTLTPQAGTWTLVLDFAPTATGDAISSKFEVRTSDTATPVSETLPDSATTALKAGTPFKAYIKVRNASSATESYFLDPRLTSMTSYPLVSLTDPAGTAPPTDNIPQYLVPTDTVRFAATAKDTVGKKIEFDSSSPIGDPDLESNQGTSTSLSYAASPVTPGEWSVIPAQVGPFGADGVDPVAVTTTFTARTQTFDPTITSSATEDLWQLAIDPKVGLTTVTAAPGATVTIPVLITPTGTGVKRGVVYLDTADLIANAYGTFLAPNGNQVAAIPFTYKVK